MSAVYQDLLKAAQAMHDEACILRDRIARRDDRITRLEDLLASTEKLSDQRRVKLARACELLAEAKRVALKRPHDGSQLDDELEGFLLGLPPVEVLE